MDTSRCFSFAPFFRTTHKRFAVSLQLAQKIRTAARRFSNFKERDLPELCMLLEKYYKVLVKPKKINFLLWGSVFSLTIGLAYDD
eukprot:UN13661